MYVLCLRVISIWVLLVVTAGQSPASASSKGHLGPIGEELQGHGGTLKIDHGKGPPRTIEEELRRHKIQLTKPALVNALRSTDPEVRSLAAAKLAQDKAAETVPAIVEALTVEKLARTRVNIASSLALLGDARGFSALQNACQDPRMPPWLRMEAAYYMFNYLRPEDVICRRGLVAILRSGPDADSLTGATSLLRRFQDFSLEESQAIFHAAVKALLAPEISLRLVASRVLGEMGNISAIPYLEAALSKEQDKTVGAQIKADLQKLQKKR